MNDIMYASTIGQFTFQLLVDQVQSHCVSWKLSMALARSSSCFSGNIWRESCPFHAI